MRRSGVSIARWESDRWYLETRRGVCQTVSAITQSCHFHMCRLLFEGGEMDRPLMYVQYRSMFVGHRDIPGHSVSCWSVCRFSDISYMQYTVKPCELFLRELCHAKYIQTTVSFLSASYLRSFVRSKSHDVGCLVIAESGWLGLCVAEPWIS